MQLFEQVFYVQLFEQLFNVQLSEQQQCFLIYGQ